MPILDNIHFDSEHGTEISHLILGTVLAVQGR